MVGEDSFKDWVDLDYLMPWTLEMKFGWVSCRAGRLVGRVKFPRRTHSTPKPQRWLLGLHIPPAPTEQCRHGDNYYVRPRALLTKIPATQCICGGRELGVEPANCIDAATLPLWGHPHKMKLERGGAWNAKARKPLLRPGIPTHAESRWKGEAPRETLAWL